MIAVARKEPLTFKHLTTSSTVKIFSNMGVSLPPRGVSIPTIFPEAYQHWDRREFTFHSAGGLFLSLKTCQEPADGRGFQQGSTGLIPTVVRVTVAGLKYS